MDVAGKGGRCLYGELGELDTLTPTFVRVRRRSLMGHCPHHFSFAIEGFS